MPDDPDETLDGPPGPRRQLPLGRVELPVYVPRRPRPWRPVVVFVFAAVVAALIVWLVLR